MIQEDLDVVLPLSDIVSKKKGGDLGMDYSYADQIFLASMNKSHIAWMSGKNTEIKKIEMEELLPPIEEIKMESTTSKRKRINFSDFQGVRTSRIIQYQPEKTQFNNISAPDSNPQANQKSDNYLNPSIGAQLDDDDDTLTIVKFQGKQHSNLLQDPHCYFCEGRQRIKCKIVMQNQSTVEIYVEKQFQAKKGDFEELFCTLNFDTVQVRIDYNKIFNKQQFAIIFGSYTIIFQHRNPEIVLDWYNRLKAMKDQCKGAEHHLTRLLQVDNFYKRRYETQQFFTKNCRTGDILLFEDTHFFAKAQRFFTRSDFDHVAVAIEDNHYGLLMFQSTSGGVSLTPWRSVIRYGWFENIPRITWRRLNAKRDSKFYSTIQSFVKENLQKSYSISLAKLTANVSMIRTPSGKVYNNKSGSKGVIKSNIDAAKGVHEKTKGQVGFVKSADPVEQGYFCSELVATLYKQLGILTRDTKCSNYQPACKFIPGDFTQRTGRKLDYGDLSPQYDIFFDRKLLKLTYTRLKIDSN